MLTTVINASNRVAFQAVLSPESFASLSQPNAIAIGVVLEDIDYTYNTGMAVGALVAEMGDDIELTWLYVDLEYRHLGVGRMMLTSLVDSVRAVDPASRVFSLLPNAESSAAVADFLSTHGFVLESPAEAAVYTVDAGTIHDLVKRHRADMQGVLPLQKLPELYLRMLATDTDMDFRTVNLPFNRDDYMLCSTCVVRDGTVRGLFLFQPGTNGNPALMYSWAKSKNDLAGMLAASSRAIMVLYPPETPVELSTMSDTSRNLAALLGGDKDPYTVSMAVLNL